MKLSVIVPVFNEAATIEKILKKIDSLDIDKEIIIVNDASSDDTAGILERVVPGLSSTVEIKTHPENRGKGSAIRTGLKSVKGEFVVIQDADLEYDPEDFKLLLETSEKTGAGVVYGSRFLGDCRNMSLLHYLGNRFLSVLTSLLYGCRVTDMETCYKLIRADVAARLNLTANRFDIEPEITSQILASGVGVVEVPISYEARGFTEGKKIGWKDGFAAVRILIREKFRSGLKKN